MNFWFHFVLILFILYCVAYGWHLGGRYLKKRIQK